MYRYSYNTHWTQLSYSFFNLLRQKQKWQKVIAIVDSYGDANNPPTKAGSRRTMDGGRRSSRGPTRS